MLISPLWLVAGQCRVYQNGLEVVLAIFDVISGFCMSDLNGSEYSRTWTFELDRVMRYLYLIHRERAFCIVARMILAASLVACAFDGLRIDDDMVSEILTGITQRLMIQ